MKSKLITIGRWIAVLPVLVLAYVIAYYFASFVQSFWADPDSWAVKYIIPISASYISGMVSIALATNVAPAYKPQTAFLLLILMMLLNGACIFLLIQRKEYYSIVAILASAVGNIAAYVMNKEEKVLEEL